MPKTTVLTREELFDLIWSTPRSKLSARLHVSDVAIAKACRRHDIPMPGRGYWAKPGKAQKRPSLPDLKPGAASEVSFTQSSWMTATIPPDLDLPKLSPVVEAFLNKPHPLVTATQAKAKTASLFTGRLQLKGLPVLDLRVSASGLDFGLRLYDAILKASEPLGCTWSTKDDKTLITYRGYPIQVYLKELLRKGPPPVVEPPKRVGRRAEPNWDAIFGPSFTWESTGNFEFVIESYIPRGFRHIWRITPSGLAKSVLADLVSGIPKAASAAAAESQRRKDEEKLDYERYQLRVKKVVDREKKRLLRLRLIESSKQLAEAQSIRALCDQLEMVVNQDLVSAPEAAQDWIKWARREADSHDPLIGDLTPLLDMEIEVPRDFKHGVIRFPYPFEKRDEEE